MRERAAVAVWSGEIAPSDFNIIKWGSSSPLNIMLVLSNLLLNNKANRNPTGILARDLDAMKRIIWIISMLPPISFAQNEIIWICQGIQVNGLFWQTEEGYRWERVDLINEELILSIKGNNASYNLDSKEVPLSCEEFNQSNGEKNFSCVRDDGLAHDFLVLNQKTGQGALSQLGGAITSNTFFREQVVTSMLECEKG